MTQQPTQADIKEAKRLNISLDLFLRTKNTRKRWEMNLQEDLAKQNREMNARIAQENFEKTSGVKIASFEGQTAELTSFIDDTDKKIDSAGTRNIVELASDLFNEIQLRKESNEQQLDTEALELALVTFIQNNVTPPTII